MKRHGAYFLILAIALSVPFHIAYLYFDYYGDLNFHYRKYYTAIDEENLLTYLRDNPRALYHPPVSFQEILLPFLEAAPLDSHSVFVPDSKEPVLRC